MSKYKAWSKRRGKIYASGGWRQPEGVILNHGLSMLEDLAGKRSWFEVFLLNATGRLPNPNVAKWLEALHICISWPDSRIWCNTMGAFAGSTRAHPVTGLACGLIASDAIIYGTGPLKMVAQFIANLHDQLKNDVSLPNFFENECHQNGKLFLPGWARPLSRGDERIEPMMRTGQALGFEDGPYLQAAMHLDKYVYENTEPSESINIGGYLCAFLLDQGYTPTEIARITTLVVNGGIHACYAEAADELPHGYLALQVEDIEYIGPGLRKVNKNNKNSIKPK